MKVMLIIIALSSSGLPTREYPMASMQECIEVLKHTKLMFASNSDENEELGVVTCAYEGGVFRRASQGFKNTADN